MATLTSVEQASKRPAVGERAPGFALPSVRGPMVDLASYRERRNVIVWFSRGFTCPFCRIYTDGIRSSYAELQTVETEVIQVAPNLLESARRYFGASPLPFPFVCDPDKRLFAVYGLGDRGVLDASLGIDDKGRSNDTGDRTAIVLLFPICAVGRQDALVGVGHQRKREVFALAESAQLCQRIRGDANHGDALRG